MDNKNYDRPYIISPFYQTSTLKKKVVFSFSACFEPANKFKINITFESKKKNNSLCNLFPNNNNNTGNYFTTWQDKEQKKSSFSFGGL